MSRSAWTCSSSQSAETRGLIGRTIPAPTRRAWAVRTAAFALTTSGASSDARARAASRERRRGASACACASSTPSADVMVTSAMRADVRRFTRFSPYKPIVAADAIDARRTANVFRTRRGPWQDSARRTTGFLSSLCGAMAAPAPRWWIACAGVRIRGIDFHSRTAEMRGTHPRPPKLRCPSWSVRLE